MKVDITINVPEGPDRDTIIGAALEQCWRDIGNAIYEARIEDVPWEQCHIPIHSESGHRELIGHVDLSVCDGQVHTKETT